MNAVQLAVDGIATYRLTKLVTDDGILDTPRDAFLDWCEDNDHPKLAELIECRWCASVWIGGGVILARRYAPKAWRSLAQVLVFSAAAALLARLEED